MPKEKDSLHITTENGNDFDLDFQNTEPSLLVLDDNVIVEGKAINQPTVPASSRASGDLVKGSMVSIMSSRVVLCTDNDPYAVCV